MGIQGPPLALSVNFTDATGVVTRLGSEDTNPENVPTGISFRTARDGFGDASMTLRRRIDRDYVDVNLLDEVQLVGADGTVAYEGRIGGAPRSFDGAHTVSLQFAGWIAHTRDRQFTEIYVDRDLAQWQPLSTTRRAGLSATGFAIFPHEELPDETGLRALSLSWFLDGKKPIGEVWYDAGSNNIAASVYYDWVSISWATNAADANWFHYIFSGTLDSTPASTLLLNASATSGAGTFTPATSGRYMGIDAYYNTVLSSSPSTQRVITHRRLAVYGSHGLTKRGTAPEGFYASDVMRNVVARFCPKLNTGGIQDTTFPIPHLTFRDLTHPYAAMLEVNKYHLWDFAVWDNRTLYYKPVDLTDYDWEVRLDDLDYPAAVSLQGDSTQDLANGVTVVYTDVTTGKQETLLPTDNPELTDTDVENPFTKHGYDGWKNYQVSVPTTEEAALQLGRAALAEFNQPLAPGSIVIGPYVRDRAGHPQQAWKVRAGDRVAITSSTSLSDRPRMISESQYDHDSKKVTMSLDGGIKRLDAVVDRLSVALQAANLS